MSHHSRPKWAFPDVTGIRTAESFMWPHFENSPILSLSLKQRPKYLLSQLCNASFHMQLHADTILDPCYV